MIRIRPFLPPDQEALDRLFCLVHRLTFSGRPPEMFQPGDFQKSVAEDQVWVAEQDGVPVGFVSVFLADNFIHNLFVHPDAQGQGVGRQLLQTAESHLTLPMTLKVALDNQTAGAFYAKQGWSPVSIHEDAEEPFILYRKG